MNIEVDVSRLCVYPPKYHPIGNKYHEIVDSLSNIVFHKELVEGEDRPKKLGREKYHKYGKTWGILLRLDKPLFQTVEVADLDGGLFVLFALIDLKKMRFYVVDLIKESRYWPRYMKGEEIKAHFGGTPFGGCNILLGTEQREI